jgi:hypothetical protein
VEVKRAAGFEWQPHQRTSHVAEQAGVVVYAVNKLTCPGDQIEVLANPEHIKRTVEHEPIF